MWLTTTLITRSGISSSAIRAGWRGREGGRRMRQAEKYASGQTTECSVKSTAASRLRYAGAPVSISVAQTATSTPDTWGSCWQRAYELSEPRGPNSRAHPDRISTTSLHSPRGLAGARRPVASLRIAARRSIFDVEWLVGLLWEENTPQQVARMWACTRPLRRSSIAFNTPPTRSCRPTLSLRSSGAIQ
jgi:hypothetical protein